MKNETCIYKDGTSAYGVAPVPRQSPAEQDVGVMNTATIEPDIREDSDADHPYPADCAGGNLSLPYLFAEAMNRFNYKGGK